MCLEGGVDAHVLMHMHGKSDEMHVFSCDHTVCSRIRVNTYRVIV